MTLTVTIKVVPRSSATRIRRQRWTLDKAGMIKCYVASPPEKGKANRELIKLLADAVNLPPSTLSITHGATHRVKTMRIPLRITRQKLLQLLGLDSLDLDYQLSIPE